MLAGVAAHVGGHRLSAARRSRLPRDLSRVAWWPRPLADAVTEHRDIPDCGVSVPSTTVSPEISRSTGTCGSNPFDID